MTNKSALLIAGLALAFAGGITLPSCYYDSKEELGLLNQVCDTTAVSFTSDIAPIMDSYCNSCHSSTSADALGGGNNLDGYANIINYVVTGSPDESLYYQSVAWTGGASFMPKASDQISACEINTIRAWINQGALNN